MNIESGFLRRLVMGVVAAVCVCALSTAAAEGYPTKPIRLVVPFVPGGGASIMAHYVGQALTEAWGQSVVVDNRGGAGGVIGTDIARRATPDGYTLVMATASTMVINPLVRKVTYDPVRDFTPIVQTSTVPLVLVVSASVPVKSVKELIAYSKSPNVQVNFASSGTGTISHLAGELFKSTTGARMTHVPYKGGGQAVIDLLAGHVQVGFVNILEALPHVKEGRLRALAVTTATRSAVMPSLPTVAEAGVPGFDVAQWSGILGPAGLPHSITAKLNAEVGSILARPDMRAHLLAMGADPGGGSPAEFGKFIRSEIAKWRKLVQSLDLNRQR